MKSILVAVCLVALASTAHANPRFDVKIVGEEATCPSNSESTNVILQTDKGGSRFKICVSESLNSWSSLNATYCVTCPSYIPGLMTTCCR